MINSIMQLISGGGIKNIASSELISAYSKMSIADRTNLQNMLNDILPPIISKALRITMNDSEAFRNWLGEQIKSNLTQPPAPLEIKEKY